MGEEGNEFIERSIAIGFIISTEYIQQMRTLWNEDLIQADSIRMVVRWCINYFDKYGEAPKKHIQDIYIDNLVNGLDKAQAELIELLLEGLSEEYEREEKFNVKYLVDTTQNYFKTNHLQNILADAQNALEQKDVREMERIISGYTPIIKDEGDAIDPFSKAVRKKVKEAFAERAKPLLSFPKSLGRFWNDEMSRGSFVAFMGREKIGKTFLLIDFSIRAVKSGCKVAFFQAGDMTELQQIRRIAIYLARCSDKERYCQNIWLPNVDCLYNQNDECNKSQREACGEPVLPDGKTKLSYDELLNAYHQYPEHAPCFNCKEIKGVPWLTPMESQTPLTWKKATKHLLHFGRSYKKQFMLSSHVNESLSIAQIKAYLSIWERTENFVPDVIIIDYADLLMPDPDMWKLEHRNQQNKIWQRLRALSQEKNCLVVTVTQIKAEGYDEHLLTMKHFSEDKRKFAHVTAMYGLNQTPEEKQIGLMRINELAVREADFNSLRPVTITQRLQIGRPMLGSFF